MTAAIHTDFRIEAGQEIGLDMKDGRIALVRLWGFFDGRWHVEFPDDAPGQNLDGWQGVADVSADDLRPREQVNFYHCDLDRWNKKRGQYSLSLLDEISEGWTDEERAAFNEGVSK